MYTIVMNNCIFCKIVKKEIPALIVYEDEQFIAFLDIRPQTRGHLQLIPKEHHRWIYDLSEMGPFFTTAQKISRGIIPILGAQSVSWITYGMEIEHAHLWLVPRYTQTETITEGGKTHAQANETLRKLLYDALN